ncbi:MAG: HK97 family phage prohead protease [Brevinematia bacterium]
MKLNRKAYSFALEQIRKGNWKQSQDWEPPTPEQENRYIEENGIEKYALWHLGIREDTNPETKQHYAYPFTDDFKKVNRKGLIAIRQRAGQQGHDDIFNAAGRLLEEIDGDEEKKIVAYRNKELEEGEEVYTFVVTKEVEDRVGDVVVVSGGRFENYLKNPIVLFNHQKDALPIGKAESIYIKGDMLVANIRFSNDFFAQRVKNLVDEGILNATSIGFIPLKQEPKPNGGVKILEWELLEISIVNIPANPYALLQKYLLEGSIWKNEIVYNTPNQKLLGEVVLEKIREIKQKLK